MNRASVAAGVPPAVEGGRLAPRNLSWFKVREHGACANAASHEPPVRSAGRLTHSLRIPTGFRPEARGWTAPRAYPGCGFPESHNPTGVAAGGRNPGGVD